MDRYLLMLAEVHNWGLKCAPCWESTTWRVFSDRAYVVESQYMRKPDEDELQRITSYAQLITTKKKRGKMRMSSFEKMLAAMETDPWRTPGLDIQACDGEGWKIEMYKCIRTEAEGKYEFLKSKKLQHFLNSTKETPN